MARDKANEEHSFYTLWEREFRSIIAIENEFSSKLATKSFVIQYLQKTSYQGYNYIMIFIFKLFLGAQVEWIHCSVGNQVGYRGRDPL